MSIDLRMMGMMARNEATRVWQNSTYQERESHEMRNGIYDISNTSIS